MMDLLLWPRPSVFPLWARPIIIYDDDLTNAKIELSAEKKEDTQKVSVKSSINKAEFSLSADIKNKEDKENFKKQLIDFVTEKVDKLIDG